MMCTSKKEWNKKEIKNLWEKNKADFAGDITAPEIFRMSKKYIGKKVLDIGAGSGALMKLIPNSNGIDLTPKDKNILEGDISNLPFKNEDFDTIFATEVLEHLDDKTLNTGLKEINRTLKKGGFFILTVPYKEDLIQNIVSCPVCGVDFHRWGHLQSFDKNIVKLLEKNKFEVIEIRILPLGFIASHKFFKYVLWLIESFGFLKEKNIFLVARK